MAVLSSPSFSSTLSQIWEDLYNTKQKSGQVTQVLWKYIQSKDTAGREWLTLSMKTYQLNLGRYLSLSLHIVL